MLFENYTPASRILRIECDGRTYAKFRILNDFDKPCSISVILGKTLLCIERDKCNAYMIFSCSDGTKYIMTHEQECCECVHIEDISGDIDDILATPILSAEESKSSSRTDYYYGEGMCTWTYYKLATIKGDVSIRWHGSSNGYYSEEVDFKQLAPDQQSEV